MSESILKGKRILAVDDDEDILVVLEEEVKGACPDCSFDKATSYEEAVKCLESAAYDVVVLDIMGVRGFDLLDIAVKKSLRVVMLTAHSLNPKSLERSYEGGARAYLPKEKLGEIVPYLEDVLTYDFEPGWKRLYKNLRGFFDDVFGTDWEKVTGIPRDKWGEY